ncbi:MAG: cystathionine beta-lyase [Proteobacteria bacterium]|nr:cystathionine beta-lyase [Pseudomonadota bacterium]
MSKLSKDEIGKLAPATRIVANGRNPDESFGFVSTPPYRGSTVLYPDADACLSHRNRYTYGRRGNPTMEALTSLWSELEGAAGTVVCPSGASACAVALLSVLGAGDHLLVTDSVYRPTRDFCDRVLARYGVTTTYFDPQIGAGISALFQPNTKAVFTESPGSLTFEMQDIPAIAAAAKAHGAVTLMDNTWATPLCFRPLDHGVDISINAATKYPSGHSDLLAGLVAANADTFPRVLKTHGDFGIYLGPDDVFLLLRGLRTMPLRLKEQAASALAIAEWLEKRPDVVSVAHPALPSHPGHALFKRDFSGASSLFGLTVKQMTRAQTVAFLDNAKLFGMGYSWGGFESLIIPVDATEFRTAVPFAPGGSAFRLQIGLEDTTDLITSLEAAFAAAAAA